MPSQKTRMIRESSQQQEPTKPKVTHRTSQSTANADRQPSNSSDFSPDNLTLLHRTIGNRAFTRMLQTPQTKGVSGKPVNRRIQRTLIDGVTQDGQLNGLGAENMNNKAYTNLTVAFIDYANLMKRNMNTTQGQDDKTKGESFYADVDNQLRVIYDTSYKFLDHDKHKKLDTAWLKTLVERDIPETKAAARWVRGNFAAYRDSTYMNAMTAAGNERKTSLMNYVEHQSPISWAQMSDAQKQLLEDNRDADAARVAAIRREAQKMMEQKIKPREVLAYMAQEARKFVQDVVAQYVEVAGLQQSDIGILGAGSFDSGEMFPYSDIDVQIMTTGNGNGAMDVEQMHLLLHNIRMRVRIANMQDSTGQWKNTLGWDVDQLVQDAYDPATAVARDANKGLAQSSLLYATNPAGEQLAGDLKQRYTAQGQEAAKAKMELDLYAAVRQGDWWMKKSEALDEGREPFEFKEKFMRLPKIFLNVLAMYHGLGTDNSWDRVDELVKTKQLSSGDAKAFKAYLDIVSNIRLKYQFFYEHEGLDMVSPTPGKGSQNRELYPKGYYTLTNEDRTDLKKAQQIQQNTLTELVYKLREMMYQ